MGDFKNTLGPPHFYDGATAPAFTQRSLESFRGHLLPRNSYCRRQGANKHYFSHTCITLRIIFLDFSTPWCKIPRPCSYLIEIHASMELVYLYTMSVNVKSKITICDHLRLSITIAWESGTKINDKEFEMSSEKMIRCCDNLQRERQTKECIRMQIFANLANVTL